MITREQILEAVQKKLEDLTTVNALWEAGSTALGRADQYSDIDLIADVADGRVDETVAAIDEALMELSPIADKYEVPRPTWHGHYQAFVRLRDTSKFLLIDYVIIENSNKNKFLDEELHGTPIVYFDRANVVQPPPFDKEAHQTALRNAFLDLKARFPIFVDFAEKEILRGRAIDALAYYNAFQLRPLVTLLRMKYDPYRHSFGQRYLYHYLPEEDVTRLERLTFVGSAADLEAKIPEATAWCRELIEEMQNVE